MMTRQQYSTRSMMSLSKKSAPRADSCLFMDGDSWAEIKTDSPFEA